MLAAEQTGIYGLVLGFTLARGVMMFHTAMVVPVLLVATASCGGSSTSRAEQDAGPPSCTLEQRLAAQQTTGATDCGQAYQLDCGGPHFDGGFRELGGCIRGALDAGRPYVARWYVSSCDDGVAYALESSGQGEHHFYTERSENYFDRTMLVHHVTCAGLEADPDCLTGDGSPCVSCAGTAVLVCRRPDRP